VTGRVVDALELRVGEEAELTLPGRGSAGYQWFASVEPPEIVALTRRSGGEPAGGQGSYDDRFVVTALRAGRSTIHFEQRRAFVPGAAPRALRDVVVNVLD
jgi:Chagasin family peptidase inhibitor I42